MYVCIDPSVENGNCSTGDIRLVNYSDDLESDTRHGTLQVCLNNAWGGVCSDIQFGNTEMAVACRHMGFLNQGIYIHIHMHSCTFMYIHVERMLCGLRFTAYIPVILWKHRMYGFVGACYIKQVSMYTPVYIH